MALHEYKAFASCNQGRRIEKTIEFENVFDQKWSFREHSKTYSILPITVKDKHGY